MEPFIYTQMSLSQAQAVMQLAGERIQYLSSRLTHDHTTTSRSDLLCQITLLTELINEINHGIRKSNEP
jgi:hypothetical protein